MTATSSEMSKKRLVRNMLHYCFQFYLLFIPLEYKDAVCGQPNGNGPYWPAPSSRQGTGSAYPSGGSIGQSSVA